MNLGSGDLQGLPNTLRIIAAWSLVDDVQGRLAHATLAQHCAAFDAGDHLVDVLADHVAITGAVGCTRLEVLLRKITRKVIRYPVW